MTPVVETVSKIIAEQGRKQDWIINKMNEENREIDLNPTKFSAIMCGKRRMSADEFLAFCKVTNVSPDLFM